MKTSIATIALALCSTAVIAQVNPQFAAYNDEIEMVRSLAQLERKAVIEQGMQLSPEESGRFWPIYNDYQAELAKTNNQLVKLITDYAASYETLDEKQAVRLREGYFDLQQDLIGLRKKYARKMGRSMSQVKVTRFLQLEHKLDAIQNLTLAKQIPLVQ